jgi:hypothetical protein
MFIMTEIEDRRLLKLNETSSHTHTVAYLSQHDLAIIPSILLSHARFGHINYDGFCLLRKNGLSSLFVVPRKLKQCDACILGKHNKQPFHDFTSRACRKLELIYSHLCCPMPLPFADGNKYICDFY